MKPFLWIILASMAVTGCGGGGGGGDSSAVTPAPAPGPGPSPDPDPDPGPDPDPNPEPEPQAGWVVQETGTLLDFTAVSAIDENHAWAAAGSEVFRTQDGGSTWTLVGQTPVITMFGTRPAIMHMQFHDLTHGWAVTWFSALTTSDGGVTWEQQYATLVSKWSALTSVSPSIAWMASEKFGGLTQTTDGGATWTGVAVGESYGAGRALKFVDSQTGYVATRAYEPEEGETVLKTTDGGATWTELLFLAGGYDGLRIFDITTLGPNNVWIIGAMNGGELIYASFDGGATWSQQQSDGSGHLRDVHFMSASNGWIAGRKIHRTTNGGATWSVQSTAQEGFRDLVFVTPSVGWAVGENGVILKTVTGGDQ